MTWLLATVILPLDSRPRLRRCPARNSAAQLRHMPSVHPHGCQIQHQRTPMIFGQPKYRRCQAQRRMSSTSAMPRKIGALADTA